MRRRSAVEPVIGHIKSEHRMGLNYFAGQQGDALNAILAAAGYNFSLLLRWLKGFLWLLIAAYKVSRKNSKPDPSHCSRPTNLTR
ncbi:hypothetical protein MesoLjLc_68320 [Mesorhizobium sp. L-8-10]|nr:hypothetical protein MesoLjLc_68320 [Mesorhizobium sp. L-8-10]